MSESTGTLKLSTSFTLAEEVNYIAIGGEKFALSLSAYAARIPDYEFTDLNLKAARCIIYAADTVAGSQPSSFSPTLLPENLAALAAVVGTEPIALTPGGEVIATYASLNDAVDDLAANAQEADTSQE